MHDTTRLEDELYSLFLKTGDPLYLNMRTVIRENRAGTGKKK